MYPTIGVGFDARKYGFAGMEAMNVEAAVVALLGKTFRLEEPTMWQKATQALMPFAKEFSPKWRFTIAETDLLKREDLETLAATAGASQISVLRGGKKFVLNANAAFAGNAVLHSFFEGIKIGTVRPYKKSAATPVNATEDGVLVMTGDTFGIQAMDPKKDVFVAFYASWCGHCKRLD